MAAVQHKRIYSPLQQSLPQTLPLSLQHSAHLSLQHFLQASLAAARGRAARARAARVSVSVFMGYFEFVCFCSVLNGPLDGGKGRDDRATGGCLDGRGSGGVPEQLEMGVRIRRLSMPADSIRPQHSAANILLNQNAPCLLTGAGRNDTCIGAAPFARADFRSGSEESTR